MFITIDGILRFYSASSLIEYSKGLAERYLRTFSKCIILSRRMGNHGCELSVVVVPSMDFIPQRMSLPYIGQERFLLQTSTGELCVCMHHNTHHHLASGFNEAVDFVSVCCAFTHSVAKEIVPEKKPISTVHLYGSIIYIRFLYVGFLL